MRGFIIGNSCDWSGAAGWPGQGGQQSPSELQPGCPGSHGSSSHIVQVIAPWPSPTGCRGISAPTTKPWGGSERGPRSPECHQEFCDRVCWRQDWAGCAVLHRHGLCLPMCSQHWDSGEGFLLPRRTEQCKDNVTCSHQHHLWPAGPSLPHWRGCALIPLTAGGWVLVPSLLFPPPSVQHTHPSGCHTIRCHSCCIWNVNPLVFLSLYLINFPLSMSHCLPFPSAVLAHGAGFSPWRKLLLTHTTGGKNSLWKKGNRIAQAKVNFF